MNHGSLVVTSNATTSHIANRVHAVLLTTTVNAANLTTGTCRTNTVVPRAIFALISNNVFGTILIPRVIHALGRESTRRQLGQLVALTVNVLLTIAIIVTTSAPLLTHLCINDDGRRVVTLAATFAL